MSNKIPKKIKRLQIGGLPLLRIIAERIGLKEILPEYIDSGKTKDTFVVESLILLCFNIAYGKDTLYELEDWFLSIDSRAIGYEHLRRKRFTDDRFGRALDKLYLSDRASLSTHLIISLIKKYNIDMRRVHNDSTTLKAFGKIPGKTRTGLELRRGHSKDYRPDLKQLVFSLSISSDGAVPIHYKSYAGNYNDDNTHIDTWNTIASIAHRVDFLYVADSKLCSDNQLSYIVGKGGKAITVIPNCRIEVKSFKQELRQKDKSKKEIWRRINPRKKNKREYFYVYEGNYYTKKRRYRIHWIYSSEKRKRDYLIREDRMKKVEYNLEELSLKLNKRKLKSKKAIHTAAVKILKKYKCENFFCIRVGETRARYRVQISKGRPGSGTKYRIRHNVLFTLSWQRNIESIKKEKRLDGIFPLLCTDNTLSAKTVLMAYKYQPNLEKRFSQLKSVHYATPLLFKKIERIEANMFVFFIALILQALLEREIRQKMRKNKIICLKIYPEARDAVHPTTAKVLKIFDGISSYQITRGSKVIEEYRDDLNNTQKTILKLLNIPEEKYWTAN